MGRAGERLGPAARVRLPQNACQPNQQLPRQGGGRPGRGSIVSTDYGEMRLVKISVAAFPKPGISQDIPLQISKLDPNLYVARSNIVRSCN